MFHCLHRKSRHIPRLARQGCLTALSKMPPLGAMAALMLVAAARALPGAEVANQGYRLTVSQDGDGISVRLEDRVLGIAVTDGSCLYHAAIGEVQGADRLEKVSIRSKTQSLVIRG